MWIIVVLLILMNVASCGISNFQTFINFLPLTFLSWPFSSHWLSTIYFPAVALIWLKIFILLCFFGNQMIHPVTDSLFSLSWCWLWRDIDWPGMLALKRYRLTRCNFFPHFLFSLVYISIPIPKFSCRHSNNFLHHWQCLVLLYSLKSSRKCHFTCQCPLNGFFFDRYLGGSSSFLSSAVK